MHLLQCAIFIKQSMCGKLCVYVCECWFRICTCQNFITVHLYSCVCVKEVNEPVVSLLHTSNSHSYQLEDLRISPMMGEGWQSIGH